MGRPELGTKCACASCAERFYDLNRSPAVCPKCGAEQPPFVPRVARPVRLGPVNAFYRRRPAPAAAEEEIEPLSTVEVEDTEDDDDVDVGDADIEPDTEVIPEQEVPDLDAPDHGVIPR